MLLSALLLASCAERQVPSIAPMSGPPAHPFLEPPPSLPPPASALSLPPRAPPGPELAPVSGSLQGDVCTACRVAVPRGHLMNPSIDEASGLVASAVHSGIYYTHNDSGDLPRFFAIDRGGADRGTFVVGGALSLDWEDMARGPCAGGKGSCLYFGDLGDNLRFRPAGAVYRVPEPDKLLLGEQTVQAEAFPFRYPDGSHDAKTLLVHPTTGVITIVIKVKSGPSGVYEFPRVLVANQVAKLTKVGEVEPPSGSVRYTAGDVHPRAEGVLLRTYDQAWFYAMRPDQSVGQALAGKPVRWRRPGNRREKRSPGRPMGGGMSP